jgi:hypothetical protein
LHNIQPGAPLSDALTGLLTATPYSYSITAAASVTPKGDKFDEAAVRREAYNFYFQDAWKISPTWRLNYGLRYEMNSRIKEAKHRTSIAEPIGPDAAPASFLTPGATQIFLYNPQPVCPMDWSGFAPRVSVDYAVTPHTVIHAGGAITTILPNLWQDNFVTGGIPLAFSAAGHRSLPGTAVPFYNTPVPLSLPEPYAIGGQLLFPYGNSSAVAANTQIDLQRFQSDLEALTPAFATATSEPTLSASITKFVASSSAPLTSAPLAFISPASSLPTVTAEPLPHSLRTLSSTLPATPSQDLVPSPS